MTTTYYNYTYFRERSLAIFDTRKLALKHAKKDFPTPRLLGSVQKKHRMIYVI